MDSAHVEKASRWAKRNDKLAAWLIRAAGLAVILAMFAMLGLIFAETAPLFLPAGQSPAGTARLPDGIAPGDVVALAADADLHQRTRAAVVVLRNGEYGVFTARNDGRDESRFARLPDAPEGATVLGAETTGGGGFSILWSDLTLTLYAPHFEFPGGLDGAAASVLPTIGVLASTRLDPARGTPLFAAVRGDAKQYAAVAVYRDGTVFEQSLRPGPGLLARKPVRTERETKLDGVGEIIAAVLDGAGSRLYVGTSAGELASVEFPAEAADAPVVAVTSAFRDRRPVTALAFLNGEYAVAVGDGAGGASVWFPRRENGIFLLRRSAEWPASGTPAWRIVSSQRDRGFFVLTGDGGVSWLYSTTGRQLLQIPPLEGAKAVALAVNARADNLLLLRDDGTLDFRRLASSHPESGWRGFFSRLLYEGYEKPEYVWQSTGADSAEPKLSLVPLLWGSVKGAGYALVFATPIALAAAVYLSQFARREWKARLKPMVEMLAAVPSVVIGFIAALWLAPLFERHLHFLTAYFTYDQRNSLVIAVAMGFAVIPIIFSLAEDAVTAVPPSLSAASLALGATRWQTVWRVVLPSASPGIFSAVMLGLGRAVGETMIVLMATGNTPILSLSPFNGMRTLSANIAVEMPEAPVGGTLYRTLFLCALLLFVMTLIINSCAELARRRLRRRYGRL